MPGYRSCLPDFNSRTSCEVRQGGANNDTGRTEFQLTHLLRGATRVEAVQAGQG